MSISHIVRDAVKALSNPRVLFFARTAFGLLTVVKAYNSYNSYKKMKNEEQ